MSGNSIWLVYDLGDGTDIHPEEIIAWAEDEHPARQKIEQLEKQDYPCGDCGFTPIYRVLEVPHVSG